MCFSNGLSFVFNNRFWLRKNLPLKLFFSSGLFLELFLVQFYLFFQIFWFSFRSWAHFGSAGGQLFHHKNGLDYQRRPNGHFPPNFLIFMEPYLSYFLCFFSVF